jgi:hypothetical protein
VILFEDVMDEMRGDCDQVDEEESRGQEADGG